MGTARDYFMCAKFFRMFLTQDVSVVDKIVCHRQSAAEAWLPFLAFVLPHFWGSKVADTDTTDLQLLLSTAHWTHSATDLFVHCLISSVQRLRGLPRTLFPAILPCRTCVLRFSARTTWPKYCNFLLLTSARKRHVGFNFSDIELLILWSFQLMRIIHLYLHLHLKCV